MLNGNGVDPVKHVLSSRIMNKVEDYNTLFEQLMKGGSKYECANHENGEVHT